MNMIIRPFRMEDAEEVAKLETECFQAPWPLTSFTNLASDEHVQGMLAVDRSDLIVAYLFYYVIAPELNILNIAVAKRCRRQGIARQLLLKCHAAAKEENALYSYLEVRRSNESARKLYESLGYQASYVRARYYSDSNEDAIVYRCPIPFVAETIHNSDRETSLLHPER